MQAPILNDAKDVGLVMISPATAPQATETDDLIKELRDDTVPGALGGSDATRLRQRPERRVHRHRRPHLRARCRAFLLYIIGVTLIVLTMAFRSVVVALKASITTLISALVGFGVLTFVIQQGHGLELIGLDRTGPIESFVPPIAFAILFGLSMDYEVFLMSRIREEHIHGKNTGDAVTARRRRHRPGRVRRGDHHVDGVLRLHADPDRVSKEFGLLLAVAILSTP